MPLYDYRCAACGKTTEIRHGFNDSHTDPCPECGGAMSRVFNPAPIVFKGSGFYITDSRSGGSGGSSESSSSSSDSAA
ncbi:MAG TPA: FmdB family zinc ribbon protein [Candidatus Aquilonibacter sp.]|nr:FmdB family zinc ribbon protein [Candidatus Aquilonibacter sp.]